jgi:quinol monooxygenase YgiN
MAEVVVVAQYRTRPRHGPEVASVLAAHVRATREETGCLEFVALRQDDDPDRFVLYERYADDAAFEAHRASAHFRENITDRVAPLLAERVWSSYTRV